MRQWMDHRQAYTPRFWPVLLVVIPAAWGVSGVVALLDVSVLWATLIGIVVGAVVGGVGTQLIWARWRRQHPVISPDEYVEKVIRPQARWN